MAEPSPDWTWDDFLAAATALTKAPQNWGMSLTIDVFQGIEPWVFTNGGQVLNDAWTKVVINNPAAIEACAFARSLVAKKLAPSPGGTFNEFSALGQGHLAMMGAGIWPWNYYVENGGGGDLAIVPWPKKTQQGSPVGLASFPILAASKSQDEAWEFVKYSISESFQANEAVPIEGGMPMRALHRQQRLVPQDPAPGSRVLRQGPRVRHAGGGRHQRLRRRGRHRHHLAADPGRVGVPGRRVGAIAGQVQRRAQRQLSGPRQQRPARWSSRP